MSLVLFLQATLFIFFVPGELAFTILGPSGLEVKCFRGFSGFSALQDISMIFFFSPQHSLLSRSSYKILSLPHIILTATTVNP